MKTILFLLLIFCFEKAISQIPYYDAIQLASMLDEMKQFPLQKKDSVNFILSHYLSDSVRNPNDFALPEKNPFIAPYMNPDMVFSEGGGRGFSKFASSIGNLDVTNFADGLAKFLVARAKEELNVAFFRKFQEFIQRYPEVRVIFPATYDMVSQIFSYQYASFLPALRACFHQDMNAFSTNIMELRDLKASDCPADDDACESRMEAISTFLNDDPIGRTFVAGLLVSDNILKGSNAVEILDNLANDEVCFGRTDNFSNSIRLINLMSNSLRSTQQEELWVNKKQINKLIGNDDAIIIYMGLLFATQQQESIPIIFTKANAELLTFRKLLLTANQNLEHFTQFRNNLRTLGYLAAEVSLQTKSLRPEDAEVNDDALLKFSDYASTISDFLKHGVTFFNAEDTKLANDVKLFTNVMDNAVAACYDIKSKNYTSLVLHTSIILDTILPGHYTFRNDYVKYGNFMANIIEADNSDEVKAAIEAAVLPVGSSSIKRETFSNISLNAFIGPMAGSEYLPGLENDQWAPVIGVTAPLGVAFNWGNIGNGRRDHSMSKEEQLKKSHKGGKSFSLFFPLIDVGALATFRIGDDSSHVASEVKLENIIAPGLYGYWGFGKLPVSVGFGAQIGPQLRKINAEDANLDKNFYVRFGLNIVVDIPFFNFYTRN